MLKLARSFNRGRGPRPRSRGRATRPVGGRRAAEWPRLRSVWSRYGAATLLWLAAVLVESAVPSFFRPTIFLLFYPSAFIAAVLGGTGPAFLTILLSAAGAFLIFHAVGVEATQPTAEAILRLFGFAGFAGLGCWLIGRGRAAEQALRESEEALERAQDVGRVGSWRLDIERNELILSEETYRIFGLARDTALTYEAFMQLVHPDDRDLVARRWAAAQRGEPYHFEHRILVEGRLKWVDERAQLELDAGGRPLRGVGTVQDVTERRLAEAEVTRLRERERFITALEASATAMLIVTADDSIIFANREAERLLGWTRTELQGRNVYSLLPPRFRADHAAMLRRMFEKSAARIPMGAGRELVMLRRDGSEVPVEVGLTRVSGINEHGVGVVVVSIVDITRRKAADAARRESEQRLGLLVQGTPEYVIYVQDLQGRITAWNEGGRRIFGYDSEEVIGAPFELLLSQDPGARERALGGQRLALERGSSSQEDWRRRKNGDFFWARIVVTPIRGPDGRHAGFGKVVQDLTEQKRAETQLRDTAERLKRTVLELESFAYTISHDLRSPLRAIEGYAHFLSRRLAGSPDADVRGMLERMGRAASRLDILIRDLLSYNAIARQSVELAPVDLDEVMGHVAGHYPEIGKARLEIRGPLGRARGQQSLLIQVFSNLLVNAAKFVPPERRPEIEVWCERSGGRVTIVFQDNGIGIPRESWERVFKPFERLRVDARYEGTGIGLAIVKRAVEKMGGSVTLDSELGRGSRFRVELEDA